jgi:hypothetical protein
MRGPRRGRACSCRGSRKAGARGGGLVGNLHPLPEALTPSMPSARPCTPSMPSARPCTPSIQPPHQVTNAAAWGP